MYLTIMEQLLLHAIGDYWIQSDWMALNKAKKTFNCLVHCLIYTSCFLLLTVSWKALAFIFLTHFIIDRFPIIVRKLIYWKNHFPLGYPRWELCASTGYYDDSPYNTVKPSKDIIKKIGLPRHFFITIWLYIISDNILHLLCNFLALKYLS
jgi:hypothetical protein